MRHFFSHTFFVAFLLLPIGFDNQQAAWELKKEEGGILVYTREVENSNIREFKASSKINVSQQTVMKILLDIPNYPLWIEDIEEAAIISKKENTRNFYYQLSLPWPMKDRDIAMTMKIMQQEDQSILLNLRSKKNIVEEKSGFIRMHQVTGQWLVEPIDEHTCAVTYQFLADPEGFLPAWVVNIFIVDGPFKTLQNLNVYAQSKQVR